MATDKRIIRVNASALKNATCFLRFWRIVIEGYKEPVNVVDIEFGSAFHIFAKRMAETGGDMAKSLHDARKYFQDAKKIVPLKKRHLDDLKLCSVCAEYWIHKQKYDDFEIIVANEKPAVEITFEVPFYEDDKYIINLCGTIDALGKITGGCNAIKDYKTTSAWDHNEYFSGFELSVQLLFYIFCLHKYADLHPDSFIAEFCKKPVAAFIEGVFLKSNTLTEFKKSRMFFFKEADMLEFEQMLSSFVQKLVAQLNAGVAPSREGILLGACSGGFKPCTFTKVCTATDSVHAASILKQFYKQEDYDPIKNRE